MEVCLRVDLDYVPWDTPDAEEFGHGEPAVFLRLLELAKHQGYKFHFFASTRVLRAFPATAEAVLSEGHDLDWFCKHPAELSRWEEAHQAFEEIGHQPLGFSLKGSCPEENLFPESELKFVCCDPPGNRQLQTFLNTMPSLRQAARTSSGYSSWLQLVQKKSQAEPFILPIRPQVLGRVDPKLEKLSQILTEIGRTVSLREKL
jgi:hypothetical protein